MMTYAAFLWVALGGALGSMARFGLVNAVAALVGATFPWGTLLVNVAGSFIIGLFSSLTAAGEFPHDLMEIRMFVLVGVCGGFTTFSSFSLQSVDLIQSDELVRSALYLLSSVLLCLLAVGIGTVL